MNSKTPFEGIKLETSILCKHKKIAGRVESVFCEAAPIRLSEVSSLKKLGPGCCAVCCHRTSCSCLWEKDTSSKMNNEDLRNHPSSCSPSRYAPFGDSMLYRLQRRHLYCGNMQSKLMQVIKKPVSKMYFTESEESLAMSFVDRKNSLASISNGTKYLDPCKKVSKESFQEQSRKMDKTPKEDNAITKMGEALFPAVQRNSNISANSLSKSQTSSHVNTKQTNTKRCDCREQHVVGNKSCSKSKLCSTSTLPSTGNMTHYLDRTQQFFQESPTSKSKRAESFLEFIDGDVRRPARTIDSLEDMQYASKVKTRPIKPIDEDASNANSIPMKIDDDKTKTTNRNKSSNIFSLEGMEGTNKLVNWNKDTLSSLTVQLGRTDSKSMTKKQPKKRIEKVKSAIKNGKRKQSKENVKTQGASKNLSINGKRNSLDMNANNESGIVPSKTELSGVKKIRATFDAERSVHAEKNFNSKIKFPQKNIVDNLEGKYIKNSFLSGHEFKISPKGVHEFNFIKSKDSGIGSEQVLSKTESKKIKGAGSVSSKSAGTKIIKKRKQKHA